MKSTLVLFILSKYFAINIRREFEIMGHYVVGN